MTGQIILMLYGMVFPLLVPEDAVFVSAFLMTAIYIGLWNLKLPYRMRQILPWVWLLLCLGVPELSIFAAAACYSMLNEERYVPAIILALLSLLMWMEKEPEGVILQLAGCAFACVLSRQFRAYESLLKMYRKTRDDSTEWNIVLKEKNKNLLENQDYEIYAATLKERNRIAREIHDHVGHMLSRAILMVGAVKVVNHQEALSEPLKQLEETLNTAMTNVRESVHDLHDASVNMEEAIRGLIEGYRFCPVQLTYDVENFVPREVKYSFIAIVKEGLNNIAKHSGAEKAEITVREHPGLYQLVIKDNGSRGRLKEKMTDSEMTERAGIGIQNMRERVKNLGGTFQIASEKGFSIYITVPKKGEG